MCVNISLILSHQLPDPQTPTINPPSPVNKPLPPLPPSSSPVNKPLPPPPTTKVAGSTSGEGEAPGNQVDKRRKSNRLTVHSNEKVRGWEREGVRGGERREKGKEGWEGEREERKRGGERGREGGRREEERRERN